MVINGHKIIKIPPLLAELSS